MLFALCNVVLWSIAGGQVRPTSRIELNADLFAFQFREFVDFSLKRNEFQVADDIDRQFTGIFSLVRSLQQVAENSYESGPKNLFFPLCCDDTVKQYDVRFGREVLLSEPCVHPTSPLGTRKVFLDNSFTLLARNNLLYSQNIRWQYFASPEGYVVTYPGFCIPPEITHLNRPWYQQTVNRYKRNVVLLIDSSKSMSEPFGRKTRLDVAKSVAIAILQQLGQLDLVAVINFQNRPETLRVHEDGGCFASRLALATERNKVALIKHISSIKPKGASYIIPGIKKALKFLTQSFHHSNPIRNDLFSNRSSAQNIVHLITDGSVTGGVVDLVKVFNEQLANSSNPFFFLLYGIDRKFDGYLNDLVRANGFPENVQTKLTFVNSSEDALLVITEMFREFSVPAPADTVIRGTPYIDIFETGEIITLSTPVFQNGIFLGVMGIDILLRDVLVESLKYRPNHSSYSFVMDRYGWLISHPQLWKEEQQSGQVFFDVFEPVGQEFIDAFNLAKTQGSASLRDVNVTRIKSPGSSFKYGSFIDRTVTVSYDIEKIDIVDLYLVTVVGGNSYSYRFTEALPDDSFLFHVLDLNPAAKPCQHLNQYSSKRKSAVFLSKRAFNSSEFFLAAEFSPSHVKRLADAVETNRSADNLIKYDARYDIISSRHLDHLWLLTEADTEVRDFLAWRYLGTESGIFRIFPATEIPINYDPVLQDWYRTAVAFRNKIVMLPPYRHKESGALIIGLSAVLFRDRYTVGTAANDVDIWGVVGIEFLLTYVNSVFLSIYPDCDKKNTFRCFVIDHGGYVLLVDDYLKGFERAQHISEIEPHVTSVLIRHGVLQRANCSNVVTGELQRTYWISEEQEVYWGTFGHGYFDFFGFKLIPVSGTNTFIVIRSVTQSRCVSEFYCTCPAQGEECIASWKDRYCECPCVTADDAFESCTYSYVNTEEVLHGFPCVAPPPEPASTTQYLDLSSFDQCFNISFAQFGEKKYNEVVLTLIAISAALPIIVSCWVAYHSDKFSKLLNNLLSRKQGKRKSVEKFAQDLMTQYARKKQDFQDQEASFSAIKHVMRKHFK